MSKLDLPPYTGYQTPVMRMGRARHESDRGTKRARLGNRHDRALYKSAKGHLTNPTRYAQLCLIATRAVYNRDTVAGAPA